MSKDPTVYRSLSSIYAYLAVLFVITAISAATEAMEAFASRSYPLGLVWCATSLLFVLVTIEVSTRARTMYREAQDAGPEPLERG